MRRSNRRGGTTAEFRLPKSSLHHHEFANPADAGSSVSEAFHSPCGASSLWYWSSRAFTGYVTRWRPLAAWRSIGARTFLPAPFGSIPYVICLIRSKGCGAVIQRATERILRCICFLGKEFVVFPTDACHCGPGPIRPCGLRPDRSSRNPLLPAFVGNLAALAQLVEQRTCNA